MKLIPTKEKLTERMKELTCLYEISKIISNSSSIEKKVIKKIISSTKKAWRHNDDALVEIQVADYILSTSLIDRQTICQTSNIQISNTIIGFIKVHYPQNKYDENDFLKEEQKLLNTIAFEIGNYIEKFQNLEKRQILMQTIERIDRLSILGEMTAGIAHELNNPLANILGFAQLIKSQNADPEIDNDITTLIDSVIYSGEIVKRLLSFSSEIPQQLQLQQIKPIATFALSLLRQNLQKKNIACELILKNDSIIANVDSVQLTQVLLNLILNAIYASPEHSTIKVIIESSEDDLSITIKDQGIGISKKIKEKIYEPFFTTKRNNEGSGLGLSVVNAIVKSHNGKITVRDNNPSGTIFIIKIPIN